MIVNNFLDSFNVWYNALAVICNQHNYFIIIYLCFNLSMTYLHHLYFLYLLLFCWFPFPLLSVDICMDYPHRVLALQGALTDAGDLPGRIVNCTLALMFIQTRYLHDVVVAKSNRNSANASRSCYRVTDNLNLIETLVQFPVCP